MCVPGKRQTRNSNLSPLYSKSSAASNQGLLCTNQKLVFRLLAVQYVHSRTGANTQLHFTNLYRIPIINESLQLAYTVNPAYVRTLIHSHYCSCSNYSLAVTQFIKKYFDLFDANCQLRKCVIFKAGCVTYRVHGVMWSLSGAICKGRSVLSLKIYTIDLFLHARKTLHCNTTCQHRILASKPNFAQGGP